MKDWVLYDGVMAQTFPFEQKSGISDFEIEGSIKEVSDNFNKEGKASPFGNAGMMSHRQVFSVDASPVYKGTSQNLGDILVNESFIPEDFFISEKDLPRWIYEKGAKK